MKILHFLIGDSFAVRFLSVFTNTTINEHHAIEFDWSNGEENIMDISKLGSKTLLFHREVEFWISTSSTGSIRPHRNTPVKVIRYHFESF